MKVRHAQQFIFMFKGELVTILIKMRNLLSKGILPNAWSFWVESSTALTDFTNKPSTFLHFLFPVGYYTLRNLSKHNIFSRTEFVGMSLYKFSP